MCGHAFDIYFFYYYLLAWRVVFIWEFSFPLCFPLHSVPIYSCFFFKLFISSLSCTVVKSIIKLNLNLKVNGISFKIAIARKRRSLLQNRVSKLLLLYAVAHGVKGKKEYAS